MISVWSIVSKLWKFFNNKLIESDDWINGAATFNKAGSKLVTKSWGCCKSLTIGFSNRFVMRLFWG